MRRNSRITGRRICAVVALAMVIAWGIPALAPAALASPVVAPAVTRSALPHGHHPTDVNACIQVLKAAKYTITGTMLAGCTAGAASYPSSVSDSIALALCAGFLTLALVHPVFIVAACLAANPAAILESTQWCANSDSNCLNAWGGGPWVKDYTGGPELSDTHQDFMVIDENGVQNGNAEIMFYGSGSWFGQCIGDAYNNSGRADVSLDPCGLPGQSAGWGTQMTWGTSGCPSGEAWFHDNHWNGYLGPGSSVNGSPFYLNKPSPVCFTFQPLEQ